MNYLDFYQKDISNHPLVLNQQDQAHSKSTELFNNLRFMAPEMVSKVYRKDEFIYAKDQPANEVYFVLEGWVKVGRYCSSQVVLSDIITRGEVFGEMVLTGEDKRIDFAQAMDDGTCIYGIKVNTLQKLMYENLELTVKFFRILGFRLRRTERKAEALVFDDARTRIIDFLKDTALEKGQKVGYETMIKQHLTHKDIASLTGTSRQTVTSTLNELRSKNLITFDRRRILIRDMDKLLSA